MTPGRRRQPADTPALDTAPQAGGTPRTDSLCPMASHPDDRDLADDDSDDDSEEAESSTEDPPSSKSGRSSVRGSRTPSPGTTPRRRPSTAASSARSTRWAIDRLDERERRFSFVASGGAAVLGIVLYLVENSAHFHRQKNQLSPQTVMVIGLVGGALLLGATLLGRRAPVGFVALFIGLLFSNSTLFLALPFLALAFWILYRSYKVQREASAEARAARAESASARPATTRPRGGARSRDAQRSQGARAPATKKNRSGRAGQPEANKRYTPKRPPPPAPKPSRRERKATQAPD